MEQPTLRELHDEGRNLIPINARKKALINWKPYEERRSTWDEIQEWSQMNPAIWASVTGSVIEGFAYDFDGDEGRQTLSRLGLDPHRITPREGYHVDFTYPDWEVKTRGWKNDPAWAAVAPGVDVRGYGGYINLLGTSVTGPYSWVRRHDPYPWTTLPEHLLRLMPRHEPRPLRDMRISMSGQRADELLSRGLDGVDQGNGRNDSGIWLACQLRDDGYTEEEAWPFMEAFVRGCPPVNTKGFPEPYTLMEARASLDQAFSRPPREPWGGRRPFIAINRQLREVTDDTANLLIEHNVPPKFFRQGRTLVEIDQTSEIAKVAPISLDRLRRLVSILADWGTVHRDDEGKPSYDPSDPPSNVLKGVLSSDAESFPPLKGIVAAPFPREDGSIVTKESYDEQSELWLDLPKDLADMSVPDEPTDDEVLHARAMVEDLFCEFPFVDDASKANTLALLLTMVLRPGIDGLVPLAVIDAHAPGTGKTYLVKVCAMVATGRDPALKPAPNGNEEELRKVITATLDADERIVIFDNLARPLRSGVLAGALTSEIWNDRILGASRTVSLPQGSTWVVTGNNVVIAEDLRRRCYHIALDAKVFNPWERTFERPDLEGWVKDHRRTLLEACLTLWRAWWSRGRPTPSMKPLGSYPTWQDVMGGILHVAQIEGFLGNSAEFQEQTDPDTVLWAGLLRHWLRQYHGQPVMARQLADHLDVELPGGLAEYLSTAGGMNKATRLTRKLKSIEGQRFNAEGLRIERAGTDGHEKTLMWKVMMG